MTTTPLRQQAASLTLPDVVAVAAGWGTAIVRQPAKAQGGRRLSGTVRPSSPQRGGLALTRAVRLEAIIGSAQSPTWVGRYVPVRNPAVNAVVWCGKDMSKIPAFDADRPDPAAQPERRSDHRRRVTG